MLNKDIAHLIEKLIPDVHASHEDASNLVSSLDYFYESTQNTAIELPLVKLSVKTPSQRQVFSVTVSDSQLVTMNSTHKNLQSMKLEVSKLAFRDHLHEHSIGSLDDFRLTQDDGCCNF